ncbi:hypothetical protein COU58_01470 [Candidatus Pacearchaeota archaeon CG10_big_fil_rev_8_21_14_0_10_32_42]|nr:MAG: hypothetical protein COU58_01470 [Candidatus Pacearchaeota archaeon CG10_big_fil_rev_8_21_14_0_10_32_42]
MAEHNFIQRKIDVLNKKDKSFAQGWDEKVISLCERINKKENYYTTSSCSGRVLLMLDQPKKSSGLFLWVEHGVVNLENLKKSISELNIKGLVKFKCEPPIIHLVCKTLEDAEEILEKGQKSGWKNSGIINLRNNIVVELHGTEKLELPIFEGGKFLVDDKFLLLLIEKSNQKLEKGWNLIKNLEILI